MSLLRVQNLSARRGLRAVLDRVGFTVEPGEVVGLVGRNGAGKTTLLRAALGLLPASGESSLAAMPPAARARHAAWMPQSREIAWPVTVETLVMLGRIPHLAAGARPGDADRAAVAAALRRMDLDDLAHRPATELSGGEQARALIARVLAQDTPLILADEPVAGLDPGHQMAAMEEFRRLAAEGRAVVVSLHDLGLAVRHCSRLLLLHDGRIAADGPPRAVLTADNLARAFGIAAHFVDTARGPVFQPLEALP
ncbi:ATP-binding cassette domain-containing protein [Rhodobacterales bacterium HKCCE2091]|nr:ATP-binding cassette domain-containing protein [Rhodobacterales bacterium HKCCE2091]